MFKIPDLRKRILFTLGFWRFIGWARMSPLPESTRPVWNRSGMTLPARFLACWTCFRAETSADLGLCAWRHAVHYCIDHFAVYAGALSASEEISGRRRDGTPEMNQWTRYMTVVLPPFRRFSWRLGLTATAIIADTWPATTMIVITLTTGTIFVMWLGEQITERGVGNGISLLIFAGIVIGLPRGVLQVFDRVRGGDTMQTLGVVFLIVAACRTHRSYRLCRIGKAKHRASVTRTVTSERRPFGDRRRACR